MGTAHVHSHHHAGDDHAEHHSHALPEVSARGRAFAIVVALNLVFMLGEATAGLASGSMALVADAGHNLADVLSLLLAWGASVLAARPPSARFTYGMKSSSILAAIANAALLWVAIGAILVETIRRLFEPEPVAGDTLVWVAGVGIAVNAVSAWLFARGRKDDLNVGAAFTHLLADAAVSAGVVLAGLLVIATRRAWIDPLASLLVTAVIAWGSWGLLREALALGLLAVPRGIDEVSVRRFLAAQPGVCAIHDLHIWPMSTTETAITAHLLVPAGHPGDDFLHHLSDALMHRFGIVHPTIQIETGAQTRCPLVSDAAG